MLIGLQMNKSPAVQFSPVGQPSQAWPSWRWRRRSDRVRRRETGRAIFGKTFYQWWGIGVVVLKRTALNSEKSWTVIRLPINVQTRAVQVPKKYQKWYTIDALGAIFAIFNLTLLTILTILTMFWPRPRTSNRCLPNKVPPPSPLSQTNGRFVAGIFRRK